MAIYVSDPAHPQRAGTSSGTPWGPSGITVADNHGYVASGTQGLLTLRIRPPGLLGDLNCDGRIDFDDIDPFLLALYEPSQYAQTYPDCNLQNGDFNFDGIVMFSDIDPFVAVLMAGP